MTMSFLPSAVGAAMLFVPDHVPETDATYVGRNVFAVADGVDHRPGSGARALTHVARLATPRRRRSVSATNSTTTTSPSSATGCADCVALLRRALEVGDWSWDDESGGTPP